MSGPFSWQNGNGTHGLTPVAVVEIGLVAIFTIDGSQVEACEGKTVQAVPCPFG